MRDEHKSRRRFVKKGQEISIDSVTKGLLKGDRRDLAKGITLIESSAEKHYQLGQELLKQISPHSGNSIRIGITGVPGAGKSTFIEAFGEILCNRGHKVAVLAIDPTSTITGGSILGDKTRMETLSRNPQAFVRPSPTAGTLGGVHRKTRETIALCEAAGYDVILIETVGVGQSEVIVRGMVDFFMLLAITGAGDELQGMKKGIIELADAIVVNKADGKNKTIAEKTKREFNQILHFLQPATKGWQTRAHTCSSLKNEGLEELWELISVFQKETKESGVFQERRQTQSKEWLHSLIKDRLLKSFFNQENIKIQLPLFEKDVMNGEITASQAMEKLFSLYS
jgi:LAO/AO transport system kinase